MPIFRSPGLLRCNQPAARMTDSDFKIAGAPLAYCSVSSADDWTQPPGDFSQKLPIAAARVVVAACIAAGVVGHGLRVTAISAAFFCARASTVAASLAASVTDRRAGDARQR